MVMMATMAINNQHCDKLTSCSHLLFLCNSSVDLLVTILYKKKTLEGTFQLLLTTSLLLEKLHECFVERRKKIPSSASQHNWVKLWNFEFWLNPVIFHQHLCTVGWKINWARGLNKFKKKKILMCQPHQV